MHVSASRRLRAVPVLGLLAVMLVLVAAGQGAARKPAAGGFGEQYKAKTSTLKKTLFNAKLLPANKTARNIALAAYHRSEMKVNLALALKCWKNNGCATGTHGKMTVAYVEGFGENVYRQMSKMEFILQALTYPQVGHIIYTSAHSNLNQALADFRAAIAKKVSVIVTYPDFGDAMLPVFKEAKQAGIPVATYAWGYVTGPGTNYTTISGPSHQPIVNGSAVSFVDTDPAIATNTAYSYQVYALNSGVSSPAATIAVTSGLDAPTLIDPNGGSTLFPASTLLRPISAPLPPSVAR